MFSIKIGCCGFPHGMKNYFARFRVVELQKTFYQIPSYESVKKWFSLSPPGFEFTVKAWQGVTHPVTSPTYRRFKGTLKGKPENYGFFQQTEEVLNAWRVTERVCSMLKTRYVLFQCPASFKPTSKNLENIVVFFKTIKNPVFQFVWEPRGGDWTDEVISEVCKKCNLVHCVDPFNRFPVTKEVAYFRLHGSPLGDRMYYYDYTEEDLNRLIEWCERFKKVYCFFNNMNMYQSAVKLMKMCSKRI